MCLRREEKAQKVILRNLPPSLIAVILQGGNTKLPAKILLVAGVRVGTKMFSRLSLTAFIS